jgi:hypothetical protein
MNYAPYRGAELSFLPLGGREVEGNLAFGRFFLANLAVEVKFICVSALEAV